MTDLQDSNRLRNPLISILLTLVIVVLGFQLIGPMIGMMIAYPFYPGTHLEFAQAMSNPFEHPEFKTTLLLMQGFGTFFGMVVLPYFFLRTQKRSLSDLFDSHIDARPVLLVLLLVIVFMGVNSKVIEWNQNIKIPGDDWARSLEETLAKGTKFLTRFNSPKDLVGVLIVIAVLPALGEEIVFRGMIQNDFFRATNNIHVSIWVSAILFSAIHVQFFGFVPRMLLGAMFGYLYFWSGNLWLAVAAHFVNNAFQVVALYLYQRGMIDIDLETTTSIPWQTVALSAAGTIALLYSYKSFFNNNPKSDIPL